MPPVTEPAPSYPRAWLKLYPRRASRGAVSSATNGNTAECSLYNNSTGAQILVVRSILQPIAATSVGLYYHQGPLGSLSGTIAPMIPDMPAHPGLLYQYNNPAPGTPDFYLPNPGGYPTWDHDFPIAMLPPNWSLVVSGPGSSAPVSFLWDWLYAQELDAWFGMT